MLHSGLKEQANLRHIDITLGYVATDAFDILLKMTPPPPS